MVAKVFLFPLMSAWQASFTLLEAFSRSQAYFQAVNMVITSWTQSDNGTLELESCELARAGIGAHTRIIERTADVDQNPRAGLGVSCTSTECKNRYSIGQANRSSTCKMPCIVPHRDVVASHDHADKSSRKALLDYRTPERPRYRSKPKWTPSRCLLDPSLHAASKIRYRVVLVAAAHVAPRCGRRLAAQSAPQRRGPPCLLEAFEKCDRKQDRAAPGHWRDNVARCGWVSA
jgi:hypothetical protein